MTVSLWGQSPASWAGPGAPCGAPGLGPPRLLAPLLEAAWQVRDNPVPRGSTSPACGSFSSFAFVTLLGMVEELTTSGGDVSGGEFRRETGAPFPGICLSLLLSPGHQEHDSLWASSDKNRMWQHFGLERAGLSLQRTSDLGADPQPTGSSSSFITQQTLLQGTGPPGLWAGVL